MTDPSTLIRRPDALLLDAGDTLIFLEPQAVADALEQLGTPVAAERIAAALHPAKRAYQQRLVDGHSHEDGWSVLVGRMLQLAGVPDERAAELLPGLRRIHDDFYFWRRVPEGLPAALERARDAGIRLGIVSNSEGRLESVLERVGLLSHFEFVVDSHLVGMQKPDPGIFELALERLGGMDADAALYAGDIPEVDVFGARAAGMQGALIDAWDDYGKRTDIPRYPSVEALIDHLLSL